MNEEQYENVYNFASKIDEVANKVDEFAGVVLNGLAKVSDWLDQYADKLRVTADEQFGPVWEKVTDNTERDKNDPQTYRINITGLTTEEIAAEIRRLMDRVKGAGTQSVDDFLREVFKEEQ